MTKLPTDKPLVRETDAHVRTDAIIVELHPKHLTLRLKGRPRAEAVDIGYEAIRQFGLLRAGRAHARRA